MASLRAAISSMERGESTAERERREREMEVPEEVGWRAEEDEEDEEEEPRIAIAANEAFNEQQEGSRNWSPCYRRLAEWCNVVLMGMVVGFGCIFAYAWVEAFSKVCMHIVHDAEEPAGCTFGV